MKIQVVIPIYQPDEILIQLLHMLQCQSVDEVDILLIDSGSDKGYMDCLSNMNNITVQEIPSVSFNHGGTRQMAIDSNPNADVYVFLTQDAILANEDSIASLVSAFDNPKIGCAYGRQLPHKNATFFASFARKYNYNSLSYERYYEDSSKYGIKTAFISNSFAAYRKEAIREVGGFPTKTILSEDMYVAAKMLLHGWGVVYKADAMVYHSHNYTIWQEFKRYFDIGVFHCNEDWIRKKFGASEQTGIDFVKAEINAIQYNPVLLVKMVLRDGMKYIGYNLGLHEKILSKGCKKKLSSNPKYWDNK